MVHDQPQPVSVMLAIFTIANLLITLGYIAVPFLVLRYLPLTRLVLFFGALFFVGCAGTHLGMTAMVRHDPGLFWTIEHVIQAIGTWGFILTFHSMLRAANRRRAADELSEPDLPRDRLADPGGE